MAPKFSKPEKPNSQKHQVKVSVVAKMFIDSLSDGNRRQAEAKTPGQKPSLPLPRESAGSSSVLQSEPLDLLGLVSKVKNMGLGDTRREAIYNCVQGVVADDDAYLKRLVFESFQHPAIKSFENYVIDTWKLEGDWNFGHAKGNLLEDLVDFVNFMAYPPMSRVPSQHGEVNLPDAASTDAHASVGSHEDDDDDNAKSHESHGTLSAETLSLPGRGDDDDDRFKCPPAFGSENMAATPRAPTAGFCAESSRQVGLQEFFKPKGVGPDSHVPEGHELDHAYSPPRKMKTGVVTGLDSMLGWATQFNGGLQESLDSKVLDFLRAKMEATTYSTCFSGVDAPGSAMASIANSLMDMLGLKAPVMHPRHLHACEIYGPSQRELQNHPCRPRHIFNSITDMLTDEALVTLNSESDYYKLMAFSKKPGLVRHSCYCLMHGTQCNHLRAHVHLSGIICISWSPMGQSKKTSGSDYGLFITWVIVRRAVQEPVVIWECSGRYDKSVMESHLGDIYLCLTIRLDSTEFGFAGSRTRCYGLMVLKSCVMIKFASLQNVVNLFHRPRTVGFGMIAVAGMDVLTTDLKWAASRPKSCAKDLDLDTILGLPNPWYATLTRLEQINLAKYQSQFGTDVAVNLNQDAEKFPVVSKLDSKGLPTMFTIIHNAGVIWYGPADRYLCPEELALLQGFEVFKTHQITTSFSHPLVRSRSAYAGQVGNSMNTCVVGSFLYIAWLFTSIEKSVSSRISFDAENEALAPEPEDGNLRRQPLSERSKLGLGINGKKRKESIGDAPSSKATKKPKKTIKAGISKSTTRGLMKKPAAKK